MRALEAELVRLDAEAGGAAAAHAAAQERAGAVRERIRETARALREAREAHDVAVGRLADRLVALYVEEPPTLVEVVLGSGGLTDAVNAQASLEAISAGDGRIVSSLEATKERLADACGRSWRASAPRPTPPWTRRRERLAQMEGLLRSRRAVLAQAAAALDALVAREQRREAAAVRRERAAAIDAGGRRVEEAVRRPRGPGAAPAPSPAAPARPPAASGGPSAVPGGAQPGGARPHRRVRVGRRPAGGVGERPVPRQVPVRPGHLAGRRRDRRPGRGLGGGAGPAGGDALRAERAGALAGLRVPMTWPVGRPLGKGHLPLDVLAAS